MRSERCFVFISPWFGTEQQKFKCLREIFSSLIVLQVENTSNFSRALLWQVLNKSAVITVTPFRALQSHRGTRPWLCASLAAWLLPAQHPKTIPALWLKENPGALGSITPPDGLSGLLQTRILQLLSEQLCSARAYASSMSHQSWIPTRVFCEILTSLDDLKTKQACFSWKGLNSLYCKFNSAGVSGRSDWHNPLCWASSQRWSAGWV